MSEELEIRAIRADDDPAVAAIIRSVMTEYGAVGSGFSIEDPEVAAMSVAYRPPRAAFFVVESGDVVRGCGGLGPLAGGDDAVCELRKMYFLPELRGLGAGSLLMREILDAARAAGYRQCYLETMPGMVEARRLYERHGFRQLEAPLGDTGHHGCKNWMIREL